MLLPVDVCVVARTEYYSNVLWVRHVVCVDGEWG
jgi:hypothetical protein